MNSNLTELMWNDLIWNWHLREVGPKIWPWHFTWTAFKSDDFNTCLVLCARIMARIPMSIRTVSSYLFHSTLVVSAYTDVVLKLSIAFLTLTHWGRDKMDAISQTTLSNAFSWMKILEFRLKFHWSLFLRVLLTIFQHWFWWWLGADQATSHYLNQCWLDHWCIYASLGLNELTRGDNIIAQKDDYLEDMQDVVKSLRKWQNMIMDILILIMYCLKSRETRKRLM